MKIAWLVWKDEDDDFPILVPEGNRELDYAYKKIRIVYSEVTED